jgi:hypothetical protein
MASANVDLSDYRKFAPPYDEPPRQRGCFFYGCIIAAILSLLLLIAVGIGFFFVYRWLGELVDQYTATAPRELPRVEMPAEDRRTVDERYDSFVAAIKAGRPTEPLVLSGQDLNALIEDRTTLKGKVYLAVEHDQLKGQVSIPVSDIIDIGLTRGRYLNGEAEFKVALVNGILVVTIDSFEINGKRPSDQFLTQLRGQNLAKDITNDRKNAEAIRKLESIEVKDGRLIIKARGPTTAQEDAGTGDSPRVEPGDGKAIVHPPEPSPVPADGGSSAAKDLPDNVLAPAGSPRDAPPDSPEKP